MGAREGAAFTIPVLLVLLLVGLPASAHEIEDHPHLVIDTDVGLDDAVALAMALQNPRVRIEALVACEGAAGREKGPELLGRLLHLMNRREVPLYAPAGPGAPREAPPFRAFAENALGRALPGPGAVRPRPFSPDAYVSEGVKTTVLVLGPLTNLAAALAAKPAIREGIEEVIVAGSPDEGFNARLDPAAAKAVRAAGIPVEFVVPGDFGAKPEAWRAEAPAIGPGTSIGEALFRKLLSDPQVRAHYVGKLPFHDELAFIYYADAKPFEAREGGVVFTPRGRDAVLPLLRRFLGGGRQEPPHVVFAESGIPDSALREDVRKRRAAILTKNGEVEWFAQVVMNELHEHLGAYSVIGVKMGLRAAELLNAPRHAVEIVSRAAGTQPVSCLNDGVMVGCGSTPGRRLFRHEPGPPGSTRVRFSYNGRRLVLDVKEEYRKRIRAGIAELLAKHGLEDPEYWKGVRRIGLDIWETWHRTELFEVVEVADAPVK